MNKLKKDLKKFINLKTGLFVFFILLACLFWFRYVSGFVLVAIFGPLTFFSVRYSKMVPHISIETNTSTSSLMGYCFGPQIGFLYGLLNGGFAYISNSFVSATYLATIFLGGVTGLVTGILHMFNFSFPHSFIIAITVRTAIAWPLFGLLGADPIERFTHQTSQFFSNLILYLPLLSQVYNLIKPFVG